MVAPVVTASMTTPDSVRVEPDDPVELVATTVEARAPLYRQLPRADRAGGGVRLEVQERRPRHPVLLRRGRVDDRRVRRGPGARRAVEAPRRVDLREQPVLDGHAAVPLARGRGRLAARAGP